MDANTNLAIAQGLTQNGVDMKAEVMATGYGQPLLDQPIAKQIGPEVVMTTGGRRSRRRRRPPSSSRPISRSTATSPTCPTSGYTPGYIDCDLAILGLQQQGKNLDQTTFASDLRKLGKFNAGGGLGCQDTDISTATYGQPAATGLQLGDAGEGRQVRDPEAQGSTTDYWTGKLIAASVPSSSATTTTAAP